MRSVNVLTVFFVFFHSFFAAIVCHCSLSSSKRREREREKVFGVGGVSSKQARAHTHTYSQRFLCIEKAETRERRRKTSIAWKVTETFLSGKLSIWSDLGKRKNSSPTRKTGSHFGKENLPIGLLTRCAGVCGMKWKTYSKWPTMRNYLVIKTCRL